MALIGSNNAEKIWNYLYAKLGNAYGVAGIMGNMEAESGLKPNNLQNTYEKKLGFTDESYTAAVDNGSYTNFVQDKAGYGLVQYTYWSLKQSVYDYAKSTGKSIGDLEMQLEHICKLLSTDYASSVWNVCKNATSIRQASDAMLLKFERPADQSEAVQVKRAGYGQNFYDKYAKVTTSNNSNGGTNMGYTNSSLVDCTVKSPNHSGTRTHKIDRITPHCVVGQLSAEGIGGCFPSGREASCNYGIGYDGRVCLIVDEQNRSWCTSSSANDQRAITIECASDTTEPYAFKQAVYDKLVKLCIDICKRNGLKKVLWFADKDKSLNYTPADGECVLTVHRWFANKSCPGNWMYSRMGQLADEINKALGATNTTPAPVAPTKTETELRKAVANWLVQYCGLKEGSTQHKAILAVFNNSKLCSRYTMTVNDAWCATAVSAAFIACGLAGKAGSGSLFECVECSCYYMVEYAKKQGIWVENDAYTPNVGDVILYDWDDNGSGDNTGNPDHVGIVVSVNGSTIKVIEGNISDSVGYRNIAVNGKYIRGYITPKYSKFATASSTAPIVMPSTPAPSASYAVGDIVTFKGTKHYASANATSGSACKAGKAKVTAVYNGKHPYHLIAEKDGGSTVYGWVDAADISGKVTTTPAPSNSSSSSATVDYAESYNKSISGTYKTTDNLNLRCGAGTKKAILCTMPKGSVVRNYGYYSTYGGVKWYYISYTDKNGKSWLGFCSSAYLTK